MIKPEAKEPKTLRKRIPSLIGFFLLSLTMNGVIFYLFIAFGLSYIPVDHRFAFYSAGYIGMGAAFAGFIGVVLQRDKMTRQGYALSLFITVWLFAYGAYILPNYKVAQKEATLSAIEK